MTLVADLFHEIKNPRNIGILFEQTRKLPKSLGLPGLDLGVLQLLRYPFAEVGSGWF